MIRKIGILGLLALLMLSACSPEHKLAKTYIKHHSGNGIMIIPTFELYKDNLAIGYDTTINYTPDQFDSIAWVQSCFIQHISDSLYLTQFTNSLIKELGEFGYDVYVDGGSDVFLSLPDPKWMIQIAQLQLNENHRTDYRESYSFESGENYLKEFRVNQVSQSSWLEVSRANTGNKQLLFLEGYIQDNFHLGFDVDLMEGGMGISGNRDSINVADVYKMAEESGHKHADLLFDYFMNDYIRENLPPGIINREYYHFNRKTKSLKRGLKERFDVIVN